MSGARRGPSAAAGGTDGSPDDVASRRAVRVAGVLVWPPQQAAEALLRRKLARDVLYMQASNFFQKGYSFVFSAIAVRTLGLAGYGDFLAVLSLYNTVNILGPLGLGQFLVVPMAQSSVRDRAGTVETAGYNLKLSTLVAVLVAVLAALAGPWVGEAVVKRPDIGALMRIVALSGIIAVAYNVATTALQATRRMRDLAIVENVDMVLAKMLPIGPLLAGWGLPGLLWSTVAGEALSACFALYWYRRVVVAQHGYPDLPELLAAAWRVPFRRFLVFSSVATVDKNVAQLLGQLPILFLTRIAGSSEVGLFGVAAKVFTLHAALQGAASKVFSVRLAQERGQSGANATRRLFWRITLGSGLAFTLAALAFLPLLPVFRWIYGADKLPHAWLVVLFAIYTAKQGFTVSLGAIFLIMNRVVTNALLKLPLLALAFAVGPALVNRWAAIGAASLQLGIYLLGDLMYFGLLSTSWFWRGGRDGASPPPSAADVRENGAGHSEESPAQGRAGSIPTPVAMGVVIAPHAP